MFGKAARTRGFGLFSLVVLIALAQASESEVDHKEDYVDDTHIIVTRDTKGPEWNYEDKGPATWKTMYSSDCSGIRQSPININTTDVYVDEKLLKIEFDDTYDNPMKYAYITNNGYTVEVQPGLKDRKRNIYEGDFIDFYEFKQLHFHWGHDSKRGSEHTIDSEQYPLEMHLVHRDIHCKTWETALQKWHGIAVLAVLFKVADEDNDALDPIIKKLAEVQKEGDTAELDDLNLVDLLPDDLVQFYTYRGSLTTPPCNEVVTWIIFKDFATISETQLKEFRNLKESDVGEEDEHLVNNFRPTQPLNGRFVRATGEVPVTWATIFSRYCSGVRQSTININTKEVDVDGDITELEFDDIYDNPMKYANITNNGFTVVVQPGPEDLERTFTEGGFDDVYEFEQLHFYWGSDSKGGSEHAIDSKKYPLEMRLVHRNTNYKTFGTAMEKEDGIVVLAVLFKVTKEDNDALDPIIEKLDEVQKEGDKAELDNLNLGDLLPNDLMPFYTYGGSLTKLTCIEVVTWVIFKDFATISERQLEQFRSLNVSNAGEEDEYLLEQFRSLNVNNAGEEDENLLEQFRRVSVSFAGEEDENLVNNFRPTQPLHGRVVEVTGEGSSATTSTLSMAVLLLPLMLAIRMALGKQ